MTTLDAPSYILTTFTKGLTSLLHILRTAESHARQNNISFDDEYLPARLAADMKPLSFQIQNATNTIKLHLGRLRGEGYDVWEDDEMSLGELYARIDRTRGLLRDFERGEMDGVRGRLERGEEVEMNWGSLKVKTQAGYGALYHGIPNFFFHLQTAYAILRAKGVPLGKKDYIEEFYKDHV
ncbi:hypothetical protein QBC34DRAFT_479306 [Podospora aff. communis PSN243]|uniref:DUF1993 domain-containing protein n=1 Tax=Podospora aff. communis PSN243 TaxID=3040156 RepID=A0AAV9G4A6_9PEZI|nr:hypothetical protein QBC34DRAFT_479306 [Podospora aff. communis PSN243]